MRGVKPVNRRIARPTHGHGISAHARSARLELPPADARASVLAMTPRAVAMVAGFLLAMLAAAPALAQGDDWEQVPSAPAPGAIPNAPPGAAGALGGILGRSAGKANLGCELMGRMAEAAAKARDKGASERSQLKTVDDPNGTLYKLAAARKLPSGTTDSLSAMMHREIAYAYAHREMTPAQLKSHFEQQCANPAATGE